VVSGWLDCDWDRFRCWKCWKVYGGVLVRDAHFSVGGGAKVDVEWNVIILAQDPLRESELHRSASQGEGKNIWLHQRPTEHMAETDFTMPVKRSRKRGRRKT
jgi:hypothetical protein